MDKQREHIAVTMLPEHKEVLRRLSQASGERMAVVVRRLIREEGERAGIWPLRADSPKPGQVSHA